MQDSNWAPKTLVVIFLYLCLYVLGLIDTIYTFFRCFLSVYTQYLWPINPISTISPMQCFYGPMFSISHLLLHFESTAFHMRYRSKIEVKLRTFYRCKNLWERWAKCVGEYYQFGVETNLWYALTGHCSAVLVIIIIIIMIKWFI